MKTILIFLFLFTTGVCQAQSESVLIAKALKLESELADPAAFDTWRQVLRINPRNYMALWKSSELCSRLGSRQPTPEKKQAFFIQGKNYALTATKLNPSGADGFYTLAVAMGRLALLQSGREKVTSVKDIRQNAENAIRLNPKHARAWHVLGKWHYEVSNLSGFEKMGLRYIYGGLPPASFEESIRSYEKAILLEPGFALNYLELAKVYHRTEQDKKAIEILRRIAPLPVRTADDTRIKKDAERYQKEWAE